MEKLLHFLMFASFILPLLTLSSTATAQLRESYYAGSCPDVESVVRAVVARKMQQSVVAGPGTLRLFFHDCFVRGCDASVMLISSDGNDEWRNPDDTSLAADAFDTVIKAKEALENNTQCANTVSCADILAIAARDVLFLSGGPSYEVELGRIDGKISTKASVRHRLPHPDFNLDQLNSMFAVHGLTQTDMIALSGAHTIGVTHCDKIWRRMYKFGGRTGIDPTMDREFVTQLRKTCSIKFQPASFVMLDAATPLKFDNLYYQNLQRGMGVLGSDQVLYTDLRSRATVDLFAGNQTAFFEAFVTAVTKLGRVGVKTSGGADGEIRRDCRRVN
ncbi:peroxidase 45-like [Typha angustifolia]|uniref:peroxidase 45-like n=1 Tax=Typha angustifolia TaxID=59011 RepID=UPI003C2AAE70